MKKVPHVILAEDEDLVAMSLSIALEDMGCRVTVTHNGLEALQVEEADPADALVTDMRMPVMDGATLIRMIRRRRPALPIIVMNRLQRRPSQGGGEPVGPSCASRSRPTRSPGACKACWPATANRERAAWRTRPQGGSPPTGITAPDHAPLRFGRCRAPSRQRKARLLRRAEV